VYLQTIFVQGEFLFMRSKDIVLRDFFKRCKEKEYEECWQDAWISNDKLCDPKFLAQI